MTTQNLLATVLFSILLASCKQTNEDLISEGVALAKQKKYKEAIKCYTKVINRNSKLQLAYYDRGFSWMGLKQYSNALNDFNKVMALQTHGSYILTENPNTPFASEEARMQVDYNEALYQRAQVKFYMDSLKSSFADFKALVANNYEKSNCFLWLGSLWVKGGDNKRACEYFQRGKEAALTNEDTLLADDMIKTYCDGPIDNR